MYRVMIEMKRGLPESEYSRTDDLICRAYTNRAGSIRNSSESEGVYIFQTEEEDLFAALAIGNLKLREEGADRYFERWLWEEDNPDENHDIKKVFEEHYAQRRKVV